ncbi:hypothetical protein PENDEC_c013G03320 [Penicillium decumbens]|uniref:Uncharacterized protein n=1 Tax=Penicillium decumbens TaxID=69771 RepID=A0A1V6PA42_PENDC|nr:hypothetical protein PENDEC_c013G03320 [Penicillium decumbens]
MPTLYGVRPRPYLVSREEIIAELRL